MSRHDSLVTDLYVEESGNLKRRIAQRLNGNACAAEDVVHDAYLRMLERLPEPASLRCPKAYLFTVASHLAIDVIRHERRTQRFLPQGAGDGSAIDAVESDFGSSGACVEDDVASRMRFERMLDSLTALSPKCRAAFVLHKLWDLPQADVGQRMGLTVSMVEKYVSQAMHHVRSHDQTVCE